MDDSKIKENVNDEREKVDDTQGAKHDNAGHCFFAVDFGRYIVGYGRIVKQILVKEPLVHQIAKYKTRSVVGESQKAIDFLSGTVD